MIGRKILSELEGGVGHIRNPDHGCRWLSVDEIANVIQIVSNAHVARVVNQNEQLHRGVIVFGADYVLHAEVILALFHVYVLRTENWNFAVIVKGLVRDNHVDLYRARGRFLLRTDDLRTQGQSKGRPEQ
jgi:hypothetical protein